MTELVFKVYDLKSGETYENKDPIMTCSTTDQFLVGHIYKDD
jgi:hypothetical protein